MSENSPTDGSPVPEDSNPPAPTDRAPGSSEPRRVGGVLAESSPEDTSAAGSTGASRVRGVGLALLAATMGAAIMVLLGGPLAFTYGLIVVAYFIGRFAALGLRIGAGPTISATNRATIAILVSLFAVVLGFMGLWVFATGEGGSLSLFDYLSSVYGALVPIQFIIATLAAWWGSR